MALDVLIVDDSPAMRHFVRRVIQLSGLEVAECREACSGEQALASLRTAAADVILTDINMAGMGGEEFLAHLDADEALRRIPVIVISTDATRHRKQRMLELGAKAYVSKPFLPETLRQAIERIFEERWMQERETGALAAAAEEVLETMFFTSLLGEAGECGVAPLAVRVKFGAEPSGALLLRMSPRAARFAAAGFFAVEEIELTGEQVGEALAELANMICGSVLSRLYGDAAFDLSTPEPAPDEEPDDEIRCRFELEGGMLELFLTFEKAR